MFVADFDQIEHRLDLVNRYNHAMGAPDLQGSRMQRDFVKGTMPPGESVSYVGTCCYLLRAKVVRFR